MLKTTKLKRLVLAAALGSILVLPATAGDDSPSIFYVGQNGSDSGYLGVQLEEETEYAEGGARITELVDDSPADKAGLEEGDIVVKFDGKRIRGPVALTKQIHGHEPGDTVSVTVVRDGRERTFDVELAERSRGMLAPWAYSTDGEGSFSFQVPEIDEDALESYTRALTLAPRAFSCVGGDCGGTLFNVWGRPKLGVQLVDTTPELREHLGGTEDAGALVSKVLSGTPAERAGIQVGDLILSVAGEEVTRADQILRALDNMEGETFPIVVMRDGRRVEISASIPEPDVDVPTGPRAFAAPRPLPVPAPRALPPRFSARPALAPLSPHPPHPVLPGTPVLAPVPAAPMPPAPPLASTV